ncbi:hypothetical protein SHIRM173S_01721 [Streptomyces hirsutus]
MRDRSVAAALTPDRRGPRHAAPRKPLFTRFHMPAGKAIALAAMPTAVLMGMGFTPTLAQADEQPKSRSLTADEYKDRSGSAGGHRGERVLLGRPVRVGERHGLPGRGGSRHGTGPLVLRRRRRGRGLRYGRGHGQELLLQKFVLFAEFRF